MCLSEHGEIMGRTGYVKSKRMIINGGQWLGWEPGDEPFIAVNSNTQNSVRQFVAMSAVGRDYAHIFLSKTEAIELANILLSAAYEIEDEHAEWKA